MIVSEHCHLIYYMPSALFNCGPCDLGHTKNPDDDDDDDDDDDVTMLAFIT